MKFDSILPPPNDANLLLMMLKFSLSPIQLYATASAWVYFNDSGSLMMIFLRWPTA